MNLRVENNTNPFVGEVVACIVTRSLLEVPTRLFLRHKKRVERKFN